MNNPYFVCACYYMLFSGEWDRVPVAQVLCIAAQGEIRVQLSQALNKTQREDFRDCGAKYTKKERVASICTKSTSTQRLQAWIAVLIEDSCAL